jgi:hypothetical protein
MSLSAATRDTGGEFLHHKAKIGNALLRYNVMWCVFRLPKSRSSELLLENWNIVFHYTTSFTTASINLPKFLGRLVKSGLCEVAVYSPGVIAWREGERHQVANLELKTHEHGLPYRSAIYTLPAGIVANKYAAEVSLQLMMLRAGELDVLNREMTESIHYVRGVMSPCVFESSFGEISLYPQLTLYENGVLNVTFRVISPSKTTNLDVFIEDYLNLFKHHVDELKVPPSLVNLDARNLLLHKDQKDRRAALVDLKRVERLVKENTVMDSRGDFEYSLVSVNLDPTNNSDAPMNLGLLKSMILSSVACLLNPPTSGWRFRWFGAKNRDFVSWGSWVGRPNVYIMSFENQPEKASEIHHRYQLALAKILARTTHIPPESAPEFVGKSLRLFEDYGLFANSALNL